jgi:hypothetical protein
MTTVYRQTIKILFVPLLAAAAASASADPVVYTLRTVADGKLGTRVFSEALVTIQMKSDTRNLQQQPSAYNSGTVYTNTGTATVTVDDGTRITIAKFAPNQVYVRYDTGASIAGFGSSISPTYPITLDCNEKQGCPQGQGYSLGSGTLGALSAAPTPYASPDANKLPTDLVHSTLLTGPAFSCAGVYAGSNACGTAAPRGLHTDRGDFFLQDQIGGTSGDPIPADVGFPFYYGWDLANYGSLQVEVVEHD